MYAGDVLIEGITYAKYSVKGDGACFFRSIAYDMFRLDDDMYSNYIRKSVVQQIRDNYESYRINIENSYAGTRAFTDKNEYIQYMSACTTYGTTVELLAAADVLKREIVVFKVNEQFDDVVLESRYGSGDNQPLYLIFTGRNLSGHFDALIKRDATSTVRSSTNGNSSGRRTLKVYTTNEELKSAPDSDPRKQKLFNRPRPETKPIIQPNLKTERVRLDSNRFSNKTINDDMASSTRDRGQNTTTVRAESETLAISSNSNDRRRSTERPSVVNNQKRSQILQLINQSPKINASALGYMCAIVIREYDIFNTYIRNPTMSYSDKCLNIIDCFDIICIAESIITMVFMTPEGAQSVFQTSHENMQRLLQFINVITGRMTNAIHQLYTLHILNSTNTTIGRFLSDTPFATDNVESTRDTLSRLLDVLSEQSPELRKSLQTTAGPTFGVTVPLGAAVLDDSMYNSVAPQYAALTVDILRGRVDNNENENEPVKTYLNLFDLFMLANRSQSSVLDAVRMRVSNADVVICLLENTDRSMLTLLAEAVLANITRQSDTNTVRVYKIDYSALLSRYRGASEKNFDQLMSWIQTTVANKEPNTISVFWFPDIENLMQTRSARDTDIQTTIKNTMLQYMDTFNKTTTLHGYCFLFTTTNVALLDEAFLRRIPTRIVFAPNDNDLFTAFINVQAAAMGLNVSRGLSDKLTHNADGSLVPYGRVVSSLRRIALELRQAERAEMVLDWLILDNNAVELNVEPNYKLVQFNGNILGDDWTIIPRVYIVGMRIVNGNETFTYTQLLYATQTAVAITPTTVVLLRYLDADKGIVT